MFLGYFTVPILLVGALTLIYAVSDVGLYMFANKGRGLEGTRQAFLRRKNGEKTEDTR